VGSGLHVGPENAAPGRSGTRTVIGIITGSDLTIALPQCVALPTIPFKKCALPLRERFIESPIPFRSRLEFS